MAAKKKATTAKRSASDRYKTQVDAETTLKFGPEDSQLAQALKDAEGTYNSDVSVAHGTRRAIEQAAKTAKPQFQKDVATAQTTVDATKATLATDLARLPAAGALAGASSRDAEGTKRRLAEMLAGAQTETDARSRDAAAGEGFAVSNARSKLGDTKEKIADRLTAQAQEKGAYASARSGELVESARDRSVTIRGQDTAADTARRNRVTDNKNADADRQSREDIAAAKDAAKGKTKRATPEKTEKIKTTIARALEAASRLKDTDKLQRRDAAGQLVNGRKDVTIKQAPKDGKIGGVDYKAGDTLATPIVIKGVGKTEELYASVALDLAYDGHLSTKNMRRLQAMGLSVRDLGLNTQGRSGTQESREAARNGSSNPVAPKPLPSGAGALIPGLRDDQAAAPAAKASAAAAKPKPAAKKKAPKKVRLFAHPRRPKSAAAGGKRQG